MWLIITALGILTGENVSGLTKTCYYDVQGSGYTKTIRAYQVCPSTIQVNNPGFSVPQTPKQTYIQAFKTGEEIKGLNKICYYSYAGSTYTKVISSASVCPISVRVQQ